MDIRRASFGTGVEGDNEGSSTPAPSPSSLAEY